jgi:hypothetical protein
MTNNQKIIYFANTPPESEKGSSIEKLNEFISNPDIDGTPYAASLDLKPFAAIRISLQSAE